jgi:uncharacterized membrane protein
VIIDDEVLAVLTAIVLIASVLSAALIIPRHTEPFLALGLLGSKGKIGDYPRTVVAGTPINLYVFIANYQGKAVFLEVVAKIGSKGNIPTNTTPLDAPPIWEYSVILDNGENITVPVQLTLTQEGMNQAIVFELWIFNTTAGSWRYTGQWNHLYVNVTRGVTP